MIEAPWTHRPRPEAATPLQSVLAGAPTSLAEVRALRMQLRATIANGGRPPGAADDDVDRLLLGFEELVSNAVRHGGSPVRVLVSTTGSGWLVEVSDAAGDSPPVPAVGRDAALGGLGLYLVAQLSAAHGWTAEDGGRKVVWARVDLTGAAAPSPDSTGGPIPPRAQAPGALTASAIDADPAGKLPAVPGRRTTVRRRVTAGAAGRRPKRFRIAPRRVSVIIASLVLAITLAWLAWLASEVDASNNEKLRDQQVEQAATLLATQVAVIRTQRTGTGHVADVTDGPSRS